MDRFNRHVRIRLTSLYTWPRVTKVEDKTFYIWQFLQCSIRREINCENRLQWPIYGRWSEAMKMYEAFLTKKLPRVFSRKSWTDNQPHALIGVRKGLLTWLNINNIIPAIDMENKMESNTLFYLSCLCQLFSFQKMFPCLNFCTPLAL